MLGKVWSGQTGRPNAWQGKLDTVGWLGRQCAVMAHARME
jgi:hypothetical protein